MYVYIWFVVFPATKMTRFLAYPRPSRWNSKLPAQADGLPRAGAGTRVQAPAEGAEHEGRSPVHTLGCYWIFRLQLFGK